MALSGAKMVEPLKETPFFNRLKTTRITILTKK